MLSRKFNCQNKWTSGTSRYRVVLLQRVFSLKPRRKCDKKTIVEYFPHLTAQFNVIHIKIFLDHLCMPTFSVCLEIKSKTDKMCSI